MKTKPKIIISARVSERVARALRKRARNLGITMSRLIANLLTEEAER